MRVGTSTGGNGQEDSSLAAFEMASLKEEQQSKGTSDLEFQYNHAAGSGMAMMAPIPELTDEELRQSLGQIDSQRRQHSTSQSNFKNPMYVLEQMQGINVAPLSPKK